MDHRSLGPKETDGLLVPPVSPTSGFCSGNFFLIAPFPDHCLLEPF